MSFRRGGANREPPPLIELPDGSVVRGARKGGITDHIAGPHLIPNVGREAMVPGEVVRRQRPKAKPKSKPEPKPVVQQAGSNSKKKKNKKRSPDPKRRPGEESRSSPEAERTQRRFEERREEPSRSRSPQARVEAPVAAASSSSHAPKESVKAAAYDPEEPSAEQIREEELKQLKALEEAKQRKVKLEQQRRKNLGGAFTLDEDDIDPEMEAKAAAREKARAEGKRPGMEKLSLAEIRASTPSISSSAASAQPRNINKDSVTALDIDGRLHSDHKFSKTWKDWDATKANDPGEIARMFMKVSAVKRRGYGTVPGEGSRGGHRPGSRSRSRSRRR